MGDHQPAWELAEHWKSMSEFPGGDFRTRPAVPLDAGRSEIGEAPS